MRSLSRFALGLSAIVALLPPGTPAAHAAPVTLLNDTFNSENGGVGQGVYSGFANFIAADVDLLGPGYFFSLCAAAGGSTPCVDMEGNGNGSLASRTAFAIVPGPVTVTFDLAGSQRGDLAKTVTVSLNSILGDVLFSEAFTLGATAAFTTFTRTFDVATAAEARLGFASSGLADSYGLLLDNIVLVAGDAGPGTDPGPVPVPEPASAGMLGPGLAAVAARRRRRPQADIRI